MNPETRCLIQGLLVFLLLFLSGCVVFPMEKEPLPYGNDELLTITPGLTTRQEVIARLGLPYAERAGSSIALYGQSRRIAGSFFLAGSGDGFSDVESGHLLMIRYDSSGKVQEAEVFRQGPWRLNAEVCASSGICIKPRFLNTIGRDSQLVGAYFYDTAESDVIAKLINTPPDRCTVFLYYNEFFLGDGDVVVAYPAGAAGPYIPIDESGYVLWRRDPGLLNIVSDLMLKTADGWAPPIPGDETSSSLEFECTAGHVTYVQIKLRMGRTKNTLKISLVDPVDGEAALRERRLLLE